MEGVRGVRGPLVEYEYAELRTTGDEGDPNREGEVKRRLLVVVVAFVIVAAVVIAGEAGEGEANDPGKLFSPPSNVLGW